MKCWINLLILSFFIGYASTAVDLFEENWQRDLNYMDHLQGKHYWKHKMDKLGERCSEQEQVALVPCAPTYTRGIQKFEKENKLTHALACCLVIYVQDCIHSKVEKDCVPYLIEKNLEKGEVLNALENCKEPMKGKNCRKEVEDGLFGGMRDKSQPFD